VDPLKSLGDVPPVVQACGTDMQSVRFAEDAAGFVAVTNECSYCVAAVEKAADDFAADVAGSADHCRGHPVSFRYICRYLTIGEPQRYAARSSASRRTPPAPGSIR